MHYTILASLTLLGLAVAAPNAIHDKRDKFDKCTVFGSNCAVQDQQFCDSDTGKISVCHQFGSDCWVRYTQEACSSKRSVEAAETKRDEFNECSVFGANCAVDGNEFCDAGTGNLSICHQVPFTSDCWVQYTETACAAKREPEAEPEPEVEKRDEFNKCSTFGASCATDGNVFCSNGIKKICRFVPFSSECWVQYTADAC